MQTDAVIRICRVHSSSAQTLVGEIEAWREDHADAMFAREVEDFVNDCLARTQKSLDLVRRCYRLLRSNQLAQVEDAGQAMRLLLTTGEKLHHAIAILVGEARRRGFTVEREAEFREASAELARQLERFVRAWPWRDQGRHDVARADILAGRFQPTDAILHELHGERSAGDPG